MTDSNTKTPISKTSEQKIKAPVAQKKTANWISVFAILLSITALAGTAFNWYQNTVVRVQQESKLAIGVSEIGGKISRLGDSISRIQQDQINVVSQSDLSFRVLALKTEFQSEMSKIVETQSTISESVDRINADLTKGLNQYVLDEVSQLLKLANNRVLFGGMSEVNTAIHALQLADAHLKSLKDSRFAEVRANINREIAELNDVKIVNVEEMSLLLNTISTSIHLFPLANEPVEKEIVKVELSQAEPITWRTELKKFWQDILGSVSVQRIDQPPKPLLVPEQRYFLDQNIQLSLAKAEFAMMTGEEEMFKRSINQAVKWLEEYFDIADSKVSDTLKQLREIGDQPVSSDLPSISGSSQALHTITGG